VSVPSVLSWPLITLGRTSRGFAGFVGAVSLVAARTLLHLPRLDVRELKRAIVHVGFDSLPLALGVAALTGGTVVVQTSLYIDRFNARAFLGWASGFAIFWEFGPLLLGLMMAARVGARNASELATLNVQGQLEGLRGVSLEPFRLLVVPRVLATLLSIVALSAIAFTSALLWESLAAYLALGLPIRIFFGNLGDMLSARDIAGGLIKSLLFGGAISLVSTVAGLQAQGGARAVGQAAARAVVSGAAAVFAIDFAVTPWLVRWLS
jgi:phospholipid/cholesterol/gamma-HCH transport system permease protein